ncbi:3-hydroxyisobutyrate dehydrogenase [Pseudoclavibacter endophyticus]|uniref:NAD(P)-dependent oxidoreductase n=1 Tax=Pseudoclavibacter endophyticus TaxID=1778590 RepID=A0A6H9WLX8_9MICO|nr:NAD(P)-dependent oxidoreductase [Pseudoclavibacter endophyticus]KAB1648811.1 NAD(P)-dependent oxidoreductase [Pseudoclavibacter endophyticus]GGA68337.1 3-hydroxyisobutyrate dehydrogenase [Pseudoclavibacter endophyticus]
MTANRPTVGFIGLGNMGAGMSRNLLHHGFPLVVTDARAEAGAALLAAGASWAGTPADVAARSDLVITMLPTPPIVRGVALGPGGILEGIRDGGTWIDMSTSVPEVADEVRAFADERGITIVDAPVSGMSVGAANGTLQIFVGADADDFRRILPVLEAMGDPQRILNVGGPGAGYAVKLLINQLWFSQLVATAEVLAVGARAGVDLEVLRQALIASPANSAFVERDVLSVLDSGDYDEGFAIALACKDLGLSVDLARSVGVPVELSSLVEQVYRRARAAYGDAAGEMTPMRLYEDLIGAPLRRVPPSDPMPPSGAVSPSDTVQPSGALPQGPTPVAA